MLWQNCNSGQAVKWQVKFPTENDPDWDTDEQTFNCDNADRHSQTWQSKKNGIYNAEFKRQAEEQNNEKRFETLFTHCVTFIYTNFPLFWILH